MSPRRGSENSWAGEWKEAAQRIGNAGTNAAAHVEKHTRAAGSHVARAAELDKTDEALSRKFGKRTENDGAVNSNLSVTQARGVGNNNPAKTPRHAIRSVIHDDNLLIKAADKVGKQGVLQREMDHLQEQLVRGNFMAGLGGKTLTGNGNSTTDVSYARGKNGARLFYRTINQEIVIVAKCSKADEDKVIKRLRDLYGNQTA